MEDETSKDEIVKSNSRTSSIKELSVSRSSIKSTKSLEKTYSGKDSLKSDKDVHFAKSTQSIRTESPDHSLTVSHKIIANWKHACSKTKDRTKDLLKRWRTLPEYDGEEIIGNKSDRNLSRRENHSNGSGWSVHVWSK